MNLAEAKRILEWTQIREDCPLITIEAFEWAIAEIERRDTSIAEIADTGDYSELTCPICHEEARDSDEVTLFHDALYRRLIAIGDGKPEYERKCNCCDTYITDFSRWCVTGPLCEPCLKRQCDAMEVEGRALDLAIEEGRDNA